jgi:hypothetical protein
MEVPKGWGWGWGWENEKDLQSKSLLEIKKEFEKFLEEIEKKNFSNKYLIAKSFGGGFSLLNNLFGFEKVVLWAPACGFAEKNNMKKVENTKLSEIKSLDELKVGVDNLKNIKSVIYF